ncbi:GFA family protein [Chromobacterium sp. ASV23]|uniref:GFA family protein n=1 Tax=Chromobacterium sp. ASV23 TaxID=2795110 RepID=UPI0018EE32A1|nr:GFA family protein [Chromobacterium sp. ASV23]
MDTHLYEGSCLCGGIRYRVGGAIKAVTHCHCAMCRKSHGAAFASYGSVRLEHLCVLDEESLLAAYPSSPGVTREFCRRCGSSLFWRASEKWPDWLSLALGSLDTPLRTGKQKHVHFDAAPAWCPAVLRGDVR